MITLDCNVFKKGLGIRGNGMIKSETRTAVALTEGWTFICLAAMII